MVEAAMLWNEPNNLSHWNFELDPGWTIFARMVNAAGDAIRAENPRLPRVLGGMSPIDPSFLTNLETQGVLKHVDVVAVHGFPLDWNHWTIHEWPAKLDEIQRRVTTCPSGYRKWVSPHSEPRKCRYSGLKRTAELLIGTRGPHPLVQPVRPAARVARDHSPP